MRLDIMCGLARPSLDVTRGGCYRTDQFWGWYSSDGLMYHERTGNGWDGKQPFGTGDVLRLLLDCDAGTLTVKKNGTLCGTPVTEGLTGDLCWAVCVYEAKRVRIKTVDPEDWF